LAILQLLPLLGAAVVFAFGERSTAVRAGKVFALAELLLCIVVTSRINPTSATLQLAERFDPLGYHVAVDGLSHGLFAGRRPADLPDDLVRHEPRHDLAGPPVRRAAGRRRPGWSACW
jgi:hypothetical protein